MKEHPIMNYENTTATPTPAVQDIPHNYLYCFATDEACPRAPHCLHATAARLRSQSERTDPPSLQSVSPVYIRKSAARCRFFRDDTPVRFARGMTNMFEDLPLKQARIVRRQVMACFSCESYFYQSRKGERLITPDEQKAIEEVFHSAGVESLPNTTDTRKE